MQMTGIKLHEHIKAHGIMFQARHLIIKFMSIVGGQTTVDGPTYLSIGKHSGIEAFKTPARKE